MTREQFEALPEAKEMFALWFDPDCRDCGWEMGEYGVEWSIGKARMDENGRWDASKPWILVKQHRLAGLGR